MSQLRLNPLTGRWVVMSSARAGRPLAFMERSLPVEAHPVQPCPFCPGNEEETPPQIAAAGDDGTWRVRVVPNRFPAFQGRAPLTVEHLGPVFSQAAAGGLHEVLVMSPRHDATWPELDDDQILLVMAALRDRMDAHASEPDLRYTQVLVNHGREAGASIEHPHAQLLAMPFVPGELAEEEAGFARFSGGCLLCATVEAESTVGHRVVYEHDGALALAPFWSGVPYELLIVPTEHHRRLNDCDDTALLAVGTALREGISTLLRRHGDVAFNVVIHSAPHSSSGAFHWHVHVLPKLTTQAGFELGTGVLINIVSPEEAADGLRGALAQ